jgi:hypothetical protein
VEDPSDKTTPGGPRSIAAAAAQRSAESHALADLAGQLATVADQLREAAGRVGALTNGPRRLERAQLAYALERARDACADAALVYAEGDPMNWKVIPWKKLGLLALAGAAGAVAAGIPETTTLFGVNLQHILIAAAGAFAGWAKRAPGDIKAEG